MKVCYKKIKSNLFERQYTAKIVDFIYNIIEVCETLSVCTYYISCIKIVRVSGGDGEGKVEEG